MASFSESTPVFEARASRAGFSHDEIDKLKAKGVDTLAKVAFVSSYAPGASSDADLIKELDGALGSPSNLGQKSAWRRLFHESYAATTQELRATAERSDDGVQRKLSQPERAERYRLIQSSTSGIDIKDRNEPSDALLDLCVNIYEDNRLRWIAWEKCTSKSQELMSDTKKDNLLSLDSEGRLKAQAKSDNIKADTGSEIMLQYALLRRGLALEMGNVLAFRLHRKWAEKLIEARMTVQSSTHAQVSFGQLMAADQRLFAELADRSREGIQSGPKGRPLEATFEAAMTLPEVLHLMQPLPRGSGSSREVEPPPKPFRGGPYERPYKGKGRGKSPGKFRREPKMPKELLGCRSSTNKGEAICFGYGLKTCKEIVKDGRCVRGLHVCAVPKCGGAHPALDCPRYSSVGQKS